MRDMHRYLAFGDQLSARFAQAAVRWHVLFFMVGLLVISICIAGINKLESSTNSRAFFDTGNPDFQTLLELEDIYVSSEQTLVLISAPEGQSYNARTLELLRDATEQAWKLPHVLRVDSLANYNHSRVEGNEIIIEPMLPLTGEITAQIAQQTRETAMSNGELIDRLVSKDGLSFAIVIGHVPPERDVELFTNIQAKIETFREDIIARSSDHEVFITGSITGDLAFSSVGERDLTETLPLAGILVVVFLILGLRAMSGVIASILVLGASGVATLGIGGWFGMALTPGNSSSPLAVVVLVAATCMHLVLIWRQRLQDGFSSTEAVRMSWEENLAPVSITSLTTAFGFLCLNFSDAPPLRDLGNMIAAGVIGGWFLSLTLMPTILIWLPRPKAERGSTLPRVLIAVVDFVLRHKHPVALVFALASFSAIFGIVQIRFNDDFIDYFDESYELRRDTDQIEARLTPLDVVQFSFRSSSEGGVFAPGFLEQVDLFKNWLESHPSVFQTNSILPLLKRLNQNVNDDNPEFLKFAETADANAQLMLLYELSLPVGHDLNAQISIDRDQTLMSVRLDVPSSAGLRDFADEAEFWLKENVPDIATKATGLPIIFARISQRNGQSMLLGTAVVLIVISGAMIVALRDIRLGLLSLVPNLLPAILAFGLWGLVLREVNLGSTVVTVMTFGIVVDDTVHLMMAYKRHRRQGARIDDAVRLTIRSVGVAIAYTTLMIAAGFSVIAMSSFALNQHIGALTALVVVTAFAADLFLLPVLLTYAERDAS